MRAFVRTAAAIVDDDIVVIGSQALHGEILSPPAALLVSREVDVYPKSAPERVDEFAEAAMQHGLVDLEQLNLGIDLMEERNRELAAERLAIVLASVDPPRT